MQQHLSDFWDHAVQKTNSPSLIASQLDGRAVNPRTWWKQALQKDSLLRGWRSLYTDRPVMSVQIWGKERSITTPTAASKSLGGPASDSQTGGNSFEWARHLPPLTIQTTPTFKETECLFQGTSKSKPKQHSDSQPHLLVDARRLVWNHHSHLFQLI